jgi:FRG domain
VAGCRLCKLATAQQPISTSPLVISWPPDEGKLAAEEEKLLKFAHQWGLHNGSRGRLSILEQLATLQHFGAPTRLIDVSLNAYIGLWFATEEKWVNGELAYEDSDGRLFAIAGAGHAARPDVLVRLRPGSTAPSSNVLARAGATFDTARLKRDRPELHPEPRRAGRGLEPCRAPRPNECARH